LLFSGLHPARIASSDDEGRTWTPLAAIGDWGGIVVMGSVVPMADGSILAFFHDDGRFFRAGGKAEGTFRLFQVRSRDGGRTWEAPREIWRGTDIHPSKYDAATADLTVDFHQVNNRDPFVYRTTDYGRTWKAITNGLPRNNLSYAKVILEDPVRRGLLYLGLENGIYVSFDAGETWLPLQNDLPAAPVSGIQVQTHFNDLVISTYGRGFFILDDVTPLQQLTPEVMAATAHLFQPRAAYRFRNITAPSSTYDDPTTGEDPQYGASINYWL
ncbi:MAG: hypothetical protein ACKOFO_06390, partial [Gemmatimonadota bacterium]